MSMHFMRLLQSMYYAYFTAQAAEALVSRTSVHTIACISGADYVCWVGVSVALCGGRVFDCRMHGGGGLFVGIVLSCGCAQVTTRWLVGAGHAMPLLRDGVSVGW